jgi:hypothetical protein
VSRGHETGPYIEVPRKNGKSTLVAGICLYLLTADGEPGGEIYSVAADREQDAAKDLMSYPYRYGRQADIELSRKAGFGAHMG